MVLEQLWAQNLAAAGELNQGSAAEHSKTGTRPSREGSLRCQPCIGKARLAQSTERKALNLVVVGSSPTVGVLMSKRTQA